MHKGLVNCNANTAALMNRELITKGHSSVVDIMLSDQKLFFFINELLTKGNP